MNEKKQLDDAAIKCGLLGAIFLASLAAAFGLYWFEFGQFIFVLWFLVSILFFKPWILAYDRARRLVIGGYRIPSIVPIDFVTIPRKQSFKSAILPLEERPPRLIP